MFYEAGNIYQIHHGDAYNVIQDVAHINLDVMNKEIYYTLYKLMFYIGIPPYFYFLHSPCLIS